jgi:hypothetical protein
MNASRTRNILRLLVFIRKSLRVGILLIMRSKDWGISITQPIATNGGSIIGTKSRET